MQTDIGGRNACLNHVYAARLAFARRRRTLAEAIPPLRPMTRRCSALAPWLALHQPVCKFSLAWSRVREMVESGLPPCMYFRLLLIGYFEAIDSERGIAWRTHFPMDMCKV